MDKKRTVLLSALLFVLFGAAILLTTIYIVRNPVRRDAVALQAELGSSIQHLQRIASTEYVYRSVVYATDDRRLLSFPLGSEVLFSIAIRVQAGIDMAEGFTVEVEDADTIFLTLPAPTIFLVDADEASIEEYFFQGRLFRVDWLDIGSTIEGEKELARSDALDRGILEAAQANAEVLVHDLVKLAGYDNVMIRFRPVGELRG